MSFRGRPHSATNVRCRARSGPRFDTGNPGILTCAPCLGGTAHGAGKRHLAVLDRDVDHRVVDEHVPFQGGFDLLLDLVVQASGGPIDLDGILQCRDAGDALGHGSGKLLFLPGIHGTAEQHRAVVDGDIDLVGVGGRVEEQRVFDVPQDIHVSALRRWTSISLITLRTPLTVSDTARARSLARMLFTIPERCTIPPVDLTSMRKLHPRIDHQCGVHGRSDLAVGDLRCGHRCLQFFGRGGDFSQGRVAESIISPRTRAPRMPAARRD